MKEKNRDTYACAVEKRKLGKRKMVKRIILMLLSLMTALSVCSCTEQGKTADCIVIPIVSEIYTQEDYEEACRVVFDYFIGFSGCNMTEISYAGDDKSDEMEEWADEYGVDEVIILESSFVTDSKGGDGSLSAKDTYTGWQWILARDKDGKWQHRDHGYG